MDKILGKASIVKKEIFFVELCNRAESFNSVALRRRHPIPKVAPSNCGHGRNRGRFVLVLNELEETFAGPADALGIRLGSERR